MQSHQPPTNPGLKTMFALLNRYVITEMDLWELWKFDTTYGKIYIEVSMEPSRAAEAYVDVTHLIEQAQ